MPRLTAPSCLTAVAVAALVIAARPTQSSGQSKAPAAPTTPAGSARPGASPSSTPSSSPAARDAIKETAAELYDRAVKAMNEQRWEDCRAAFLAAFHIHRSYQIAGNLAFCELRLGQNAEAAEHVVFALREMPSDAPIDRRQGAEKIQQEVRPKVAEVTVRASRPDAEILLDGRPVGRSPLATSLFVAPGTRRFEARLGGKVTSASIDASAGGTHMLELKVPEDAPPLPTTSVAPPPPRSMAPAYVMGGVGAASLIAGSVLIGVAEAQKADLAARLPRDAGGQPACARPDVGGPRTEICDELRAVGAEVNTLGNAGVVFFVAAGAALAGAAAYWFWPAKATSTKSRAPVVVPVADTKGAGLLWVGRF